MDLSGDISKFSIFLFGLLFFVFLFFCVSNNLTWTGLVQI